MRGHHVSTRRRSCSNTAVARRIASFEPDAVRAGKAALLGVQPDPTEGLIEETHLFNGLLAGAPAQERMQRFLDLGGQTREVELDVERIAGEVNQ